MTQDKSPFTSYDRRMFEDLDAVVADRQRRVEKYVMVETLPEGKPTTNTKVEWLEDDPFSYSSLLSAAVSASEVTFNVTAADGTNFTVGNVLEVESEYVLVTAISTAALTVTRGLQGTSGAAHSAAKTVSIIGSISAEGSTIVTGTATVRTEHSNYCNIIITPVKVTGTDMAVNGPGGDDLSNKQMRSLINHQKKCDLAIKRYQTAATGSGTATPRSMTGLDGFISTELHSIASTSIGTTTSTDITWAKLNAMTQAMRENGGNSWVAYCGMTAWSSIQAMLKASGNSGVPLAVNGATAAQYGFIWQRILTNWGYVTLVLDENVTTGSIYFLEDSDIAISGVKIRYMAGRKLLWKQNSSTGDYEEWYWLSEFTIEFRNEAMSGKLTAITGGA